MSKFKFVQWYGIVVCLLMAACTDVDITMPKGPKGDTGLSAYEFWKEKNKRTNFSFDTPQICSFVLLSESIRIIRINPD